MEQSLENLKNALVEHLELRHNNAKPSWEIKVSAVSGRGIYARHDIACDEVIFVDTPIVVVPRFEVNRIICVQCYKEIGGVDVLCKNGCALPICTDCENTLDHRDECKVISKWRPKCDKISRPIFRSLYLVRALLLKNNRLALLRMMQSNRCPIQRTEISEFVSEFNEFPDDKSVIEFMNHTSAVMNTNSFHAIQNGMELRGLYPLAAMLNHMCSPNTRYTFNRDRAICVRAIRPIRTGDEITISYCKTLTSTPMRQLMLQQTKKFRCTCDLCGDRTEFGTNLSALKCIDENCVGGMLLPDEPLNMSTTWSCTVCTAKHKAKQIFMLESMMSNFLRSRIAADHHDALQYCRKKLESVLLPTNQIAIEFKLSLIDKIDESVVIEYLWSAIMSDLYNYLLEHLGDLHDISDQSWEVSGSKISGRGVFATRDIRPHEVIFRDRPLIIVPRIKKSPFTCICCYRMIDTEQVCAQKCSLPLCNACENRVSHRDECDLIVQWQPKNEGLEVSVKLLNSLCAIRGLVLNGNSAHILSLLQGNTNSKIDTEIERLIGEFNSFPVDDENLLEQLRHVLAVIGTNAFETMLGPEISTASSLCGLYPLAGLLNHTCFPNTRYSFDSQQIMTMRAIRSIRKGEEIFNSYYKVMASTSIRQLVLQETKKFKCHCDRCIDPTEFETNLASLKCVDELCAGLLLPSDPLNIFSTWSCTGCSVVHQSKKILMLERVISNYLKSKMENDTIWKVLQFTRADLKNILPSTNQMALEFKSFLIRQIKELDLAPDGKPKWSIIDLQDKETFCLEILTVLDKLGMRESVKSGKLYFELFKCRRELYKRDGCTKTQQDENENLLLHSWKILHDDVTAPVDLVACIKERENRTVD